MARGSAAITFQQPCRQKAIEYAGMLFAQKCGKLPSNQQGSCKQGLARFYERWWCSPGQNYGDYIAHVHRANARQGAGPARSPAAISCLTDPMILAAAEAVIQKNTRTSVTVKGLGGLKTIKQGKLVGGTYPYVPPWPDQKNGWRYIRSGDIARTKIGDAEILGVEAKPCSNAFDNHLIISDPTGVLQRVNYRAEGVKRGDKVYWIENHSQWHDKVHCEFLGTAPSYKAALADVTRNGVASPYFAFSEKWKGLNQYDVDLASASPANALLYFLPWNQQAQDIVDKYKKARVAEFQMAEALRTQVNTLGAGLKKLQLTNPALIYNNAGISLPVANQIRKWPLCTDARKFVQAQLATKRLAAEAAAIAEERLSVQVALLEEGGFEVQTDEESGSGAKTAGVLGGAAIVAVILYKLGVF